MSRPLSFDQVTNNLEQILADPSTPLDVHLLDKLGAEVVAQTDHGLSKKLIALISRVLPVLQEDPSPVATLATKVAQYLSFSELQSIDPRIDFVAGIRAGSPAINTLVLCLVVKASESPNHVAEVARNADLVGSIVELWLSTDDSGVSQAAFDVLWSLLEADHLVSNNANGGPKNESLQNGPMWQRIFADKTIYRLLFSICSLRTVGQDGQISARQKTVAQGRLMEFVVKVGSVNWNVISSSHFADVESTFQSESLLSFAALQMVDTSDLLLHMTLLQFFRQLLEINAPGLHYSPSKAPSSIPTFSSPSLEFLITNSLHRKVINYYLDPSTLDPATANFLAAPVMAYVSAYAALYPNHLLQEHQEQLDRLCSRILEGFKIPSAQWAHGPVPVGDLDILASLPRVMLVESGKRGLNPLLAIPSKPLHTETLMCLGKIFHGPTPSEDAMDIDQAISKGPNPTSPTAEAAASRILYFQYLNSHPGFWSNIVEAAEIVAMQETAIASINLIKRVVTANWTVLSSAEDARTLTSGRFTLPTEAVISQLGPASQGNLPVSGAWALLVPPALTVVLPYLFKQPPSYANFVAGGAGDTESAVWRIATAKYDALVALQSAVQKMESSTGSLDDIKRTLKRRVAEGPMGAPNQIGSRIEALEL
ncbi:hypothetical protein H109_03033 [Trichophyton interdigitale MR816]|uniref:Uncharacterized protein n=1 Tax=Trichophyton interdigitale (strain MR816) TaxID=1215338 RepID=A0A059JBT2_TRIIM|nr:hypothetical protein H101_04526 [Trichophyton interdigitale H6]KDB25128.1 hypothetical protein H109_03033 [Trichophyton interdigitale MR816]